MVDSPFLLDENDTKHGTCQTANQWRLEILYEAVCYGVHGL
jgi:hypothetical protein